MKYKLQVISLAANMDKHAQGKARTLFVLCLQANFSLQQSDRQTSGRILQQHSDQETPAESRTGTRNDLRAVN